MYFTTYMTTLQVCLNTKQHKVILCVVFYLKYNDGCYYVKNV